jgi:hypothetical protein
MWSPPSFSCTGLCEAARRIWSKKPSEAASMWTRRRGDGKGGGGRDVSPGSLAAAARACSSWGVLRKRCGEDGAEAALSSTGAGVRDMLGEARCGRAAGDDNVETGYDVGDVVVALKGAAELLLAMEAVVVVVVAVVLSRREGG